MFLDFFFKLKNAKIPVSLNEFLNLLNALDNQVISYDVNAFYYLARTCLIKDEKLFDRFDLVFGEYFKSIERIELEDVMSSMDIPDDWIKQMFNRYFTEDEINRIKSQGGIEKLLKTLKQRLKDQKKRHQGGNKWIGTSGTSPFGAYGYNPEGIRIGQDKRRHGKAIKVWDKRIFKDFDNTKEFNNRSFKVALKKLRQWARTGINQELDIEETISDTAKNGILNIKTKKERENAIKVLLFLDVGGSMDTHIEQVEQLFSAASNVFKNLHYFYFHNCLYEGIWKNNNRRWNERLSTYDVIRTYGKEFKCIFVGDATMSPYEIVIPGGGNEHFNDEPGRVWLERAITQWPSYIWINPVIEKYWEYSESTMIIKDIFQNRMVPLTLDGIDKATRILAKPNYN
ncbi:MAG: VWA domain-containing protein [Alphaproteobacteria bacterium]|nr:MAG: VWA domain-containing protein [Alphaproteobacteria bacterium]